MAKIQKEDVYQVSSEGLAGKVKVIIRDAKVKKVIIKDQKPNALLSIPVTWRATGAIVTLALAPWFAALGVIAGIVTNCT